MWADIVWQGEGERDWGVRSAIARESWEVSPEARSSRRGGGGEKRAGVHMEAKGQSNCNRVWIVEELKQSLTSSLQRTPAASRAVGPPSLLAH